MREDHETWGMFIVLYSPLIQLYARKAGARVNQVEDILQEVLAWLYSSDWQLDLQRRGSFRRWLRQVVWNFTRMQQNGRATRPLDTIDQSLNDLEEDKATPTREIDEETRMELIERALNMLRPQFQAHGWQIFRRVYIDNQKVEQVAADLGVSKNVVYIYGTRIMRKVREVANELIDDL